MTTLHKAAQQALEALQWHYRQGHSNTLGGFRLKIDEKALRELSAALAQQAEPDHETRAELAEQQVVQLAEERDHYRNLWQKVQQDEPVEEPVFHGFMSDDGTQVDVCFSPSAPRKDGTYATAYYTAPPERKPLTEKEMHIVEEEARKNFRLAQAGPRGQMITYWDSLTPWLIRAVERAHGIKE